MLVMAGLLLLAAIATLLQFDEAEPPASSASPPVATPLAEPVQTERHVQASEERTAAAAIGEGWITEWLTPSPPSATELPGSRAGTLRGRLTVRQRPWEHPPGVEIRVTQGWLDSVQPLPADDVPATVAREDGRVRTDEHGKFAVRVLPGRGEWFFLIGQGTAWQDFQKVAKLPPAGAELDLGEVLVDARGGISGRVIDSAGLPVANAIVRAVEDPLLGANAGVESLQAARLAELRYFRTPGAMRAGPVPDWVVRRDRTLPFPRAVSDADGKFQLRGVRPGSHDLLVQHREGLGTGSARGVLVAEGRATEIGDVRMRKGSLWEVRCIDESNQPWVGAAIAGIDRSTGFGNEPQTTAADGRARLRWPGDDPVLLFQHPDGGPWLPIASEEEVDGTFLIRRPRRLIVRLVDSSKRLLPGGTVRSYYRAELFRPVDRAMPNSMQPRERTPGVHHGTSNTPVCVVASVPGFAPAIAEVAPDTTAELTLLPLQQMTVHTEDLQGHPVADASVRVKVEGNALFTFPGAQWGALANNSAFVGLTDANGDLTVPVWPAEFSFQASHPNYVASPGPRLVPQPDQRQRLLLRKGATLIGQLTLQQRPAPKGLRIRARQQAPTGNPLATSAWLQQEVAVTGESGGFQFHGLCAGNWTLQPEWPGLPAQADAKRPPSHFRTLELVLHDDQQRHLVLEAEADHMEPASVLGCVSQNGLFLVGAVVRVRELGGAAASNNSSTATRQTPPRERRGRRPRPADSQPGRVGEAPWLQRCDVDVYGEYRISGLAAQREYEVRVDLERGGRLQFLARSVVRLGDTNQPTRVDFANAAGTLHLQCTAPEGPFANRMMRLRQVDVGGEGARFELLLDANGAAFVDAMPAGDWTIEPVHGGQCEPALLSLRAAEAAAHGIRIVTPGR